MKNMYIIITNNGDLKPNPRNTSIFHTEENILMIKNSADEDFNKHFNFYPDTSQFDSILNASLSFNRLYIEGILSNVINLRTFDLIEKLNLDELNSYEYAKMLYREQLINELLI